MAPPRTASTGRLPLLRAGWMPCLFSLPKRVSLRDKARHRQLLLGEADAGGTRPLPAHTSGISHRNISWWWTCFLIHISKKRKKVKLLSHVRLFATAWTVAYQASPIHGVFQARVLEWVSISFSRGSSWPRDRSQVSCTAGKCFTLWAFREAIHVSKRTLFLYFLHFFLWWPTSLLR